MTGCESRLGTLANSLSAPTVAVASNTVWVTVMSYLPSASVFVPSVVMVSADEVGVVL